MITYFFKNPKHALPRLNRVPRAGRKARAATGRHIALPVLGGRALFQYAIKRVAVSFIGAAVVFHIALIVFFLSAGFVFSWLNPPLTSLMVERYVTDHYPPRPIAFVPFARVPAFVPVMYLKLEDKNFYRHKGIDPAAIAYAYSQNKRWGRVIMGGSTITQQMTRSIFLSPDKNYLRKYVEAVAAVTLDAVMDKKRIFELYINYIEWGKGVYGLGAAAEYYFKKPADRLTYDEASRLAAIIINPLDFDVNDFYGQPAMFARYLTLTAPLQEEAEAPPLPSRPENSPSPAESDTAPAVPPADILP